jgi:hypothetical protein
MLIKMAEVAFQHYIICNERQIENLEKDLKSIETNEPTHYIKLLREAFSRHDIKTAIVRIEKKIRDDIEIAKVQIKLYEIKSIFKENNILFREDKIDGKAFRGYFSKPLERSNVIGFSLAFPDDSNIWELYLIDKSNNLIDNKIKYLLYFSPPMRFYCKTCLINYIIQLAQLTGAMTGKKYKCDTHLTKIN